jgi:hypothetical protein
LRQLTVITLFRSAALVALLASASVGVAMTCAEFDGQLKRTYGFRPSQLSAKAKEVKSKQMDAVWEAVRADPGTLVPCLKVALARPTEDTWFLFDGSQLLVTHDESRESKAFLLDALSRVPLDDVDLRSWVGAASALGLDGFDTSQLARRWLSYPRAEYFLPEHGGHRVDRETGAMFLFGALDERYATPALTEIARASDARAKEIATWLLMSQATPEALRELQRLDATGLSAGAVASIKALRTEPQLIIPRHPPKTSREQFLAAFAALLAGDETPFNRLVESVPDGERDLVAVVTPSDLEVVRKVRRYYIAKNTQHGVEYYNQFSQILMTLVWKPELVGNPPRTADDV